MLLELLPSYSPGADSSNATVTPLNATIAKPLRRMLLEPLPRHSPDADFSTARVTPLDATMKQGAGSAAPQAPLRCRFFNFDSDAIRDYHDEASSQDAAGATPQAQLRCRFLPASDCYSHPSQMFQLRQ